MSLIFQNLIRQRQQLAKGDVKSRHPIIKDEACMNASGAASDASNSAYQTSYNAPPPAAEQIKAHLAAAKLHGAADAAHRAAGKVAMANAPTVANAHFQQARQHFNSQQAHESNARSAQDDKDQGYRS